MVIISQNLTVDEIMDLMKAFRAQCETKSGATEEMVDGINLGKFPKDAALMVNKENPNTRFTRN